MKHSRKYLAAIGIGLMFAIAAAAQDSKPAVANPPDNAETSEKLLTFEFKGGTADDYVSTVRKNAPDANIVVMGELSRINVPPIRLQSVSVWSALDVLQSTPADEQSGLRGIDVQWKMSVPQTRGPVPSMRPVGGGGAPVYIVTAVTTNSGIVKATRTMSVLEVNQMLESGIKAEDLLTAVEASLAMLKNEFEPADVRFHEQTGLLIVRGHPEQTNAVQSVVDQLSKRSKRDDAAKQAATDATHFQALKENFAECQQASDQLKFQLQASDRRREQLEQDLTAAMTKIREYEQVMKRFKAPGGAE